MFFFHFFFSLCHISSLAFVWTPLSHPSSRLFFPVHSYQGFLCFCCRTEVSSCLYRHIFVIWLAGLDGQSPPQTIINITSFLHTFFSPSSLQHYLLRVNLCSYWGKCSIEIFHHLLTHSLKYELSLSSLILIGCSIEAPPVHIDPYLHSPKLLF